MPISKRIEVVSTAHRLALEEDKLHTVMRTFVDAHRELLDEFILAVATDDRYGSEIARGAQTILRRRAVRADSLADGRTEVNG